MATVEGIKTFTAGEDLEAHRRVKLSTSATATPTVIYADKGDDCIGVTEYAADSGDPVAVKLKTLGATFEVECVVSSAIAMGTVLYGADDGKVGDSSTDAVKQGINLETPTVASGAVIEMLFTAQVTA